MAKTVAVAREGEIPAGGKKRIVLNGSKILIVHCKDGYVAVDDTCTHAESSLYDGFISGCEVECALHGARFDLRTGGVLALPAVTPLQTYNTIVENGEVKVELP